MSCIVDFTLQLPHTWGQSFVWYTWVVRVTFRLLYLPLPIVYEARWLLKIVLEIVTKRKPRPCWQPYFRRSAYKPSVCWQTHLVTIPFNSNPQTDILKKNSAWNWRVKCNMLGETRNSYTVLVGIHQRQKQRGRFRQNWRRAKGNLGKMRGVNKWHECNLTRTKFNSEVL
jgi:hypothetical protein